MPKLRSNYMTTLVMRPNFIQTTFSHMCALSEQRDIQIRELQRKIDALEGTCLDYENTIQQFRELVMQLQKCVLTYFPSVRLNNFPF